MKPWLLLLLALPACKLPDVNLATPKPIEVNLNMRLDVYQYSGDEPKPKEAANEIADTTERMRNRMAEILSLKGSHILGEDHRGLLVIKEPPSGDWAVHVKKTLDAENEDRSLLMRNEAKKSNRPLHEVQAEQAKLRHSKAEKDEWIEVPVPGKADTYEWVKAPGPA
jgi:hypothetical protein